MKQKKSSGQKRGRPGIGWPVFLLLGLVILAAGLGGSYYLLKGDIKTPLALLDIVTPTEEPAPTPVPELGQVDQTLTIQVGLQGRAISPYIYGVAEAKPDILKKLGATFNRWGGNASSRYNWELGNAWNSARDYYFMNGNQDYESENDKLPGGVADGFIAANQQAGVKSFITIPAIGYVAKSGESTDRSVRVPEKGQPAVNASGAIANYDPTSNRSRTSLPILPQKPGSLGYPPNLEDNAVYADEWVNHLITRFDTATNGGVKFYAIDNEPDLWATTHTDVHPALPGYDELLQKYLDFAWAIRQQDTTAKIVGPSLSSPARIAYSPLDEANNKTDRKAHGDIPFLEWWLAQVRASDEKRGRRTLDVLDIHYYPGNNLYFGNNTNDPAKGPARLEAPRALWDYSYKDAATDNFTALIPRMRELVSRNYPGTLLGIGEWNFGGEQHISGALAVADALGTFAEQDLYYASYWTSPPENSPAFFGFKMFANYDEKGSRFGDLFLPSRPSNRRQVTTYVARRSSDNALTIVAINKTAQSRNSGFLLKEFEEATGRNVKIYQYSQSKPGSIQNLAAFALQRSSFTYDLAPYSITLFEIGK